MHDAEMMIAIERWAYAALMQEKRIAWLLDKIAVWRRMAATCSERIPPTVLLLLAIISIQLGSALATKLFSSLGPFGTAFFSTASSSVLIGLRSGPGLLSVARTRPSMRDLGLLGCYGLALAGMLAACFLALQTIPLGVVTAIAFLGPLALAVIDSRRWQHFLWIALALLGVGLFLPIDELSLDPSGLVLAVVTAVAWGAFVPISKRVGQRFAGLSGLVLGMAIASLLLLPAAWMEGRLPHLSVLDAGGGLLVALLSTVLPMVLEFRALRRLSARTYGILVTLEPAIAAAIGLIWLGQAVGLRGSLAICCVTAAALGISLTDPESGESNVIK
jgi:inner membrane transporter RhtA